MSAIGLMAMSDLKLLRGDAGRILGAPLWRVTAH